MGEEKCKEESQRKDISQTKQVYMTGEKKHWYARFVGEGKAEGTDDGDVAVVVTIDLQTLGGCGE